MGIGELFLLGIGFSMDAFAVAICKGLGAKNARLREMAICGTWFGGFQAAMPLIGYYLATFFMQGKDNPISAISQLLAFGLLSLIGINMLREAFSKEEEECADCQGGDFSVKTMFVMAIATSIDALAGGMALGFDGVDNIWIAISFIGVITFLMSGLGVKIGNVFGAKFEKKAQMAGGIILVLLGAKILLEHLGVL